MQPAARERKPAAATGDARGASYGSCRASARQALGRRGVRWRSTDTNVTAIDQIGHLTPHRAARVFVEAAAGRERTRIHTHIDVTPSSGCVDARQVCAVPRQAVKPNAKRNSLIEAPVRKYSVTAVSAMQGRPRRSRRTGASRVISRARQATRAELLTRVTRCGSAQCSARDHVEQRIRCPRTCIRP